MLGRVKSNIKIYKKELKEQGTNYFITARIRKIGDFISYLIYKNFKTGRTFTYNNNNYFYFYHKYNFTWRNERAIEIPIFWKILKKENHGRTLEVGNVLSHYLPVKHDILDKYEMAKGVINEDVVSYKSKKKYNLIISISTLEHVGWNEAAREKMKVLKALHNLKNLLSSEGKIVFSVPFGFNDDIDELLKRNKLPLQEAHYLVRVSKDNLWKESRYEDVKDLKYHSTYTHANAILIGVIRK